MTPDNSCPDCGVTPGDLHHHECDIERCPRCLRQLASCDCPRRPPRRHRIPWSGQWPGEAECLQWGWVLPDGEPDIGRLVKEATWDWRQEKYVQKTGETN